MLQDILHRQTCWLRIKTALNLSFQFQCLLFPIELDRTSWKIRNRRDENTCLCLTLSCRGMTHCFTTLTASAVNLSLMPFTGSLLLFLVSWKLLPGVDVVYVNHLVMSNSLQLHELCGSPGSSVHGISQAKILEWIAIPFSRGSFWPRDQTQVSCNLQADSSPSEPPGKPLEWVLHCIKYFYCMYWDDIVFLVWVC